MARNHLPISPLLQADPATLPPQRKGVGRESSRAKIRGEHDGGLLGYIKAVEPGPPPFGWRDVTPYFGGIPRSLGNWKRKMLLRGYFLCTQVVKKDGQKYRRIAVCLAPNHAVTRKHT